MKRFLRRTDLRPDAQRDVSDELRFHLEMRTQEFIDAGMSPDDARRAAARAFGDVSSIIWSRGTVNNWACEGTGAIHVPRHRAAARTAGFFMVALPFSGALYTPCSPAG